MDDEKIIRLYFARSEDAITQTDKKYGGYCRTIAYNISLRPPRDTACACCPCCTPLP